MDYNAEDGRGTDDRDEGENVKLNIAGVANKLKESDGTGETVESNIAGVAKKLEESDGTGETVESNIAGLAKKVKVSEEPDGTGPINYQAPEEIFSILEKMEDDNDRITLSVASKHCLRARCLGLKRITCSVKLRKLLDVVLPSSPNLHSFESSVPLENSDMQLLARSCPELRSLRLGRQRDIDVDFVDDGDIDDDGVTGLGNCKKLVEVVLSGRIRVGDVGVVSMVRGADMLKRLNLEGCVNVGDKSLEAMGGLKRLDNLNVSGCCGITYEGLISLVAILICRCVRT